MGHLLYAEVYRHYELVDRGPGKPPRSKHGGNQYRVAATLEYEGDRERSRVMDIKGLAAAYNASDPLLQAILAGDDTGFAPGIAELGNRPIQDTSAAD